MTIPWILAATVLILTADCHPGENDACPDGNTILSEPSGYIEPPLDPLTGKYPPNAFCVWEFNLTDAKFLKLKFTRLDVELSGSCSEDRVEIYDAGDTYERYCGDSPPLPMFLNLKEKVYVNFISDDFLQFSGFRIEYEGTNDPEDSNCPGFLCRNQVCLLASGRCDGVDECGDGTDEEDCPNTDTDSSVLPSTSCGAGPAPSRGRRLSPRVVGGRPSEPGSWPWMVSFQRTYAHPSGHICGGALINRRWILTAAHCIRELPMVQQKVVMGSHFRYKDVLGQVTRYSEKNCVHPKYGKGGSTSRNDIALIKLSVPVSYSASVGPICLPDSGASLPGTCVVTGWGRTQGTANHDILKEVEVPLLPKGDCGLDKEFCLLDTNAVNSPCYGDSGGPVVQFVSGRWQLFGLISRGAEICGFHTDPTVCSQVSEHLEWIKEQLAADAQGNPLNCDD